jgi:hypothetical protein
LKKANKNMLHLFMLPTCPLQHKHDPILEVPRAWIACHTAKSSIGLFRTCNSNAPTHEMIFEDPLVKLMKNFRCEASENIGVRKVFPERVVDVSKALFSECWNLSAGFFMIEYHQSRCWLLWHRWCWLTSVTR